MKYLLLAISTAFLLTSCAGVYVDKTYVATGAANPKAIYIRPFDVTHVDYRGRHRGGPGERPIHRSQAGLAFAEILKQEVEKIAPAMIIGPHDVPKMGWIIEGDLDVVHAGSPLHRAAVGWTGLGRSNVQIHVRIIDVNAIGGATVVAKEGGKSGAEVVGTEASSDGVIYAFTLDGGSRAMGKIGKIYAPGLGYATPFDYRNAAERVYMALSRDPFRYGVRGSPVYRY